MTMVSLGAGRQSSAMLLMALDGRFGDIPDCAVFADPQWESEATMAWLAELTAIVAPFPIHVVTAGSVKESALRAAVGENEWGDGRFTSMPFFLRNPDGSAGMGRRQCTSEFKINPLQKFARSIGATRKSPVDVWIGISTDEAHRMKPSRVLYMVNRYPLVEAGISLQDCEEYLLDRVGSVPPKSACVGCPFKSDAAWVRLKAESPREFAEACEVDRRIRVARGLRAEQFLHRSLTPLAQVEFRHERQGAMFEDAFGNECEGVCGL